VAAIKVADLRKSYGAVEAVKGISFEVAEGEVFALLGPNGAGKTTTVEILEGYRRRDAGAVSVLGMDPESGGSRLRERIGIVLQECGFEELLTVREILDRQAGYYSAARPVEEIIDLVGLGEKTEARVRTLSGGQRAAPRSRARIGGHPDLIFLDEPTTGFDPAARRNAWDLGSDVRSREDGVPHDALHGRGAVSRRSRRGPRGGRIVAEGDPKPIGGRDTGPAVIRFTLPDGVPVSALPVRAKLDGELGVIERPSSSARSTS
jgi:ABC-2 type transport system ATP-binding protein